MLELTLPADSPTAGSRVGDIDWPQDTALVAIIREGRPIVPIPDEPLEAGDELLFVATPDMGPQLEELLAPHSR
jgi:trk system potassium uptake protein TrkA